MSQEVTSLIPQQTSTQFLTDYGAKIVNYLLADTNLVFGNHSPRLATIYAKYADTNPQVVNQLIVIHLVLFTSQAGLKITPNLPGESASDILNRAAEELFSLYPFWTAFELIYFIHRLKSGFYKNIKWNFNHADLMEAALIFNRERTAEKAALIEHIEKQTKATQSEQQAKDAESANALFERRSQEIFQCSYWELNTQQQLQVRQSTYEL